MPWLEALRVLSDSAEDPRRPPPPPAAEERVQEGSAEASRPSAFLEELLRGGGPHAGARGEELRGLPPSLAGCVPTPSRTKVLMLVDAMARWNIPPQTSKCCAFHNAVDDLFIAFQTMRDLPCSVSLFNPERRYVQCPTCLAVSPAEADGELSCEFCSFTTLDLPRADGHRSEHPARLDSKMDMEAAHNVMVL
mmetsp:Transcript_3753/g.11006  ORF Transcript_3753/g.11006 Transcript_3753/m.11006 type:complete len:193 (+) Transcript_3753:3-581(+)